MPKLFLTMAIVFGAAPGLIILWRGILTPPGYGGLFGGVIAAFGSLTLILLSINKTRIRQIGNGRIIRSTIVLGASSVVFLFVYILLYNFCVISHPTNHTVFFPLWTSGELRNLVSSAGGRWAALDEFGWFGVYTAVRNMPPYALPITVAVLLIFYQGVFTSLTMAFGLLGVHRTSTLDDNRSPQEQINLHTKPTTTVNTADQNTITAKSGVTPSDLDIFISHAFEDKDSFARPLYNELIRRGVKVWFDEATLELGDSLRRKIDEGLSRCRFGVVILSPSFLAKDWTQRELDGLVARETASGEKAILPIWHQLDGKTLAKYSPILADKLAARSSDGVSAVADKIVRVLAKKASAESLEIIP